jgi:hypothetical protein
MLTNVGGIFPFAPGKTPRKEGRQEEQESDRQREELYCNRIRQKGGKGGAAYNQSDKGQ